MESNFTNDDPFKGHLKEAEVNKKELAYTWHMVFGLKKVDGLETSNYMKKIAANNIKGIISI